MVRLAVAGEPVDHAEVVSHENRGELFEEVGERVACGAAVVAVGALAPLLSGVDVAEPVDKGGGADAAARVGDEGHEGAPLLGAAGGML